MKRLSAAAVAVLALTACPTTSTGDGSSSSSSSSSGATASSSGGSSGMASSSGGASSGINASSGMGNSSSADCQDECAAGAQVCDGTAAFRVCNNFDADACQELSPRINCAGGYTCQDGNCVLPCVDECPAGTMACDASGKVVTCGNFDTDSCRELGAATACNTGDRCDNGMCVPNGQACSDDCTTTGATECFGNAVRTCGNSDADSCKDWSPAVACNNGEQCTNGACVTACSDECSTSGTVECSGNGTRTCGNSDADSCLEWGAVVACDSGLSCNNGACTSSCVDDCATTGTTVCSTDNTGVRQCGSFDSDSCLDLGTTVPCSQGFTCMNGSCVSSCVDECTAGAAGRCTQDGMGVESCANHDSDICLEFGGAVACPSGSTCSNGSCTGACTDECSTMGASECTSTTAARTCGQWDTDSCLEWSTPTTCGNGLTCTGTTCSSTPPPATVLINELVYDSVGTDTSAGNSIFLELFGPADQSLDGYSLVGVDGNANASTANYLSVSLSGKSMGADGYFIITAVNASSALLAVSDMQVSGFDFQNGPDSVQLMFGGMAVDAVAYGSFSGTDRFAGEGTAAASASYVSATSTTRSLSRNATHGDTGNNSVDFTVTAPPTPRGGTGPSCSDECSPTATTRCMGTQIQTCGNFDADSCLEWGTAANCPNSGETCSSGTCSAGCTNECTMGSTGCQGSQILTCGNFDADSCLEFGAPAACPVSGQVCSGTTCSTPCTNECPTNGATMCSGSQVQTCGNFDGDSCLEWGTASACMSGQSCVAGSCQVANAPEVVLIAPQGSIQTTQGAMIRMLVDASAAAGRSITEVRYYADNVLLGSTMAAPHEFTYTIPTMALTGSNISLQAKATDSVGAVGNSPTAYLQVRNDIPVATFTATITGATQVTVDASSVSDRETATSALEVCWDWDNNNVCDTAYSTTKVSTHDYGTTGTYTVGMGVRDAVGQTARSTRDVQFNAVSYLGGMNITTTTWTGTIVVTGDLTVPAGETLTIAAGTQVLFVKSDTTPADGVGDYTLTVNGTLIVTGSTTSPVVFTGYGSTAFAPGAWDRILLTNTGSTITNAVIEYADVGVEARKGVNLTNVTVRNTRGECVFLAAGGNATSTFTDLTTTHCGTDGVRVSGATNVVNMVRHSSTLNGRHGLQTQSNAVVTSSNATLSSNVGNGALAVDSGVFTLTDSVVELNAGDGLRFEGIARGNITQNNLRRNGGAGLAFGGTASGVPSTVVANRNNIYSNATTGSDVLSEANPGLTASVTCCDANGATSATYTPPAGMLIRRVYVEFTKAQPNSGYIIGYVLDGSGNALITTGSNGNAWAYLPAPVASLKVKVVDSGESFSTDTIKVTKVELVARTGRADVTAVSMGTAHIDVRKNWLGTFPNVLSRVYLCDQAALILQGFVGAAMDNTWNTTIYKSGEVGGETWSGTVILTGSPTIAAGTTLTIQPGTQLQWVKHDQDGDGDGDFNLTATGVFQVAGTAQAPVVMSTYAGAGGYAFQSMELLGSSANQSSISFMQVAGGRLPLVVRGSSALTSVTVTGGLLAGITLNNADGAVVTRATVQDSLANGILVTNDSASTIQDSVIKNNAGNGILVQASAPTIQFNTLSYNGVHGIRYEGTLGGTASNNIIKFNQDTGLLVLSTVSGSAPLPVINNNNIYGNAVMASTVATQATVSGVTASVTCCDAAGVTSGGAYAAPAGGSVQRVKVTFVKAQPNSGYITAAILDGATGAILVTLGAPTTSWITLPPGVTSVKVKVTDYGESYSTDSITMTDAQYLSADAMKHGELSASTDTGVLNAKFNFWTSDIAAVPSKILVTAGGGTVDYTGFTGAEYPSGTVMQVGPRP